jgi:hypothetical protein
MNKQPNNGINVCLCNMLSVLNMQLNGNALFMNIQTLDICCLI